MVYSGLKLENFQYCQNGCLGVFDDAESECVVEISLVPFSKALGGDFDPKLGLNWRTVTLTRSLLAPLASLAPLLNFTVGYGIFNEILNTSKIGLNFIVFFLVQFSEVSIWLKW